ncbi:unnamed protein product [Protopolystoma xenopodis]|uniref:Uncharacterized protein n=1 Tax=Protopolystoma xenopodis TaxID=117903 RepID=A0A448X1R3_9PLAT|nr:unnamed protein product [Protopolystoma xenopodis]
MLKRLQKTIEWMPPEPYDRLLLMLLAPARPIQTDSPIDLHHNISQSTTGRISAPSFSDRISYSEASSFLPGSPSFPYDRLTATLGPFDSLSGAKASWNVAGLIACPADSLTGCSQAAQNNATATASIYASNAIGTASTSSATGRFSLCQQAAGNGSTFVSGPSGRLATKSASCSGHALASSVSYGLGGSAYGLQRGSGGASGGGCSGNVGYSRLIPGYANCSSRRKLASGASLSSAHVKKRSALVAAEASLASTSSPLGIDSRALLTGSSYATDKSDLLTSRLVVWLKKQIFVLGRNEDQHSTASHIFIR